MPAGSRLKPCPLTVRVASAAPNGAAPTVGELIFAVDEGPRRDTSAEALGEAAAGFPRGRHRDRRQCLSDERRRGRRAPARRRSARVSWVSHRWRGSSHSPRPASSPNGSGSARCPRCKKVLKLAGLSLEQIDLIELNEAFASQVLACLRELPLDPERVNVNGGAIALGHPLGCTGAKLTTTLVYEMQRRTRTLRARDDVRGRRDGRRRDFRARSDRPKGFDVRPRRDEPWMAASRSRQHRRSESWQPVATAKGGAWLLESAPHHGYLHAGADDGRAPAHRPHGCRVLRAGGAPGARAARGQGLGAGAHARETVRGSRAARRQRAGGVRRAWSSTRSARSSSPSTWPAPPSFGATYGAQANLCIVPILMFGTEDQKRRYLPGLVSGDVVGAYALSESGSGSDALGARARATRRDDGSFVLSGEKMWITSGGFADVIIVFAKVDGEHFTAFIVERAFGGVSSGKEEHKMGLHGSSTTPILLAGRDRSGRQPARRGGQGTQGRVQRAELRAVQAGRDVRGRLQDRDRRVGKVRGVAQAVRAADRVVRRDQAQDRRDDGAHLRARVDDVPHRGPDRRRHGG